MKLIHKIKGILCFVPISVLGLLMVYAGLDCDLFAFVFLFVVLAWAGIGLALALHGISYFNDEGDK